MVMTLKQRDILRLWTSGLDTMSIAERVNLPEHSVYNFLARYRGQSNRSVAA